MEINSEQSHNPALPNNDTFEEVNVPAIQAEIQERKLENLSPENLFARDVIGQKADGNVVDAKAFEAEAPLSKNQPQIVETTLGRPSDVRS